MTDDETKRKVKRILKNVAQEISGSFREDYSGRGMYGKECMGIVCEDDIECIELASSMGLHGARTDNMGLKYIVYYPYPRIEESVKEGLEVKNSVHDLLVFR